MQTVISASTKTICTWLCLEKSTFSQLKKSNKRKCETMLSGLSYILLGFLKNISSSFTCHRGIYANVIIYIYYKNVWRDQPAPKCACSLSGIFKPFFVNTVFLKKTLYTTLNTISCSTSGKKLLKQSCEREKLSIPYHSVACSTTFNVHWGLWAFTRAQLS